MKNEDLFYGTLLGDAWVYKTKKGHYVFAFEQKDADYALWKATVLDIPYGVYPRERFDVRTSKTTISTKIVVRLTIEDRKYLHSVFYKPKKVVTQEILDKLSDKAICLWFLDDGCMFYNGDNCHLSLSVNGFTDQERGLIINWFLLKYQLNFKSTGRAIRLTSRTQCQQFMNIVEQYIPSCMDYKKLSNAVMRHSNKKQNEKIHTR